MKRLSVQARKNEIMQAGLKLAVRHGYMSLTREMVAKSAKCSPALITAHFGTFDAFRKQLMTHAIAVENLAIVAQGLVMKVPAAMRAPSALREKAAQLIA